MGWIIAGVIGIALVGFWPVYDRAKNRNSKNASHAETQQMSAAALQDEKPWICPVCGESHNILGRRSSCPFEKSEYHTVPKGDMLDSMFTNTGGHYEFRFFVWQSNDMIYLTYKPDHLAVLIYCRAVTHSGYGCNRESKICKDRLCYMAGQR